METQHIREFINEFRNCLKSVPAREIIRASEILRAAYENGGRIYIFGNGGSFALASHWSSDFNKTVFSHNLKNNKRFRAVRLPVTTEELTAWANDTGYENIFVEPLKNYYEDHDCVIAISSSGNSANIIKAVKFARFKNIPVIGLSGFDGGLLGKIADIKIVVKTKKGRYDLVESAHDVILHFMTKYFQDHFNSLNQNV